MNIPTGTLLLAQLVQAVNPPAAYPPNPCGQLQLWGAPAGDLAAPVPLGIVPLWHADLAGPVLAAGSVVVVAQTAGGNFYVCGAPGYYGKSPTAIDAQAGFTGF